MESDVRFAFAVERRFGFELSGGGTVFDGVAREGGFGDEELLEALALGGVDCCERRGDFGGGGACRHARVCVL